MTIERMLELSILHFIFIDYDENENYRYFLNEKYNIEKMQSRYNELGKEFLNDYALDKTEKSD
jgi:hypothetical protein